MDLETDREIEDLIFNREKFNAFVYTPIDEAIVELERRQEEGLKNHVRNYLPIGVPKVLNGKKYAVIFRQLATPNYELRRFVSLVDTLDGFTPLFLEYKEDKFTDNNEWKYRLAKLPFFNGRGEKGGEKISSLKVIDFNTSRGKKISEIETLWGQSLIDFHHQLFNEAYKEKNKEVIFFDASEWFLKSGGDAKEYYRNFLALFVSHGILFENFMLDVKELVFTENVFLPAFIQISKEMGKKPLIIALEPTEIESELFWMCHPQDTKQFVEDKISPV